MGKIIQTAGKNTLGEFAPEFAHFNDDVLFGENWNNQDIDVKTRSIITVVALMASNYGFFFKISSSKCKKSWCDIKRDCGSDHTCRILCRLAKSMGCFQSCKGSVGNRRRRFAIRRGRDACACKRDGISNRCIK